MTKQITKVTPLPPLKAPQRAGFQTSTDFAAGAGNSVVILLFALALLALVAGIVGH